MSYVLSDSLYFFLQVDLGGLRLIMNHIGPHFQKHPRAPMNWLLITARKVVAAAESAKRLHSSTLQHSTNEQRNGISNKYVCCLPYWFGIANSLFRNIFKIGGWWAFLQ